MVTVVNASLMSNSIRKQVTCDGNFMINVLQLLFIRFTATFFPCPGGCPKGIHPDDRFSTCAKKIIKGLEISDLKYTPDSNIFNIFQRNLTKIMFLFFPCPGGCPKGIHPDDRFSTCAKKIIKGLEISDLK
eukprot:sb/3475037/